MVTILEYLQKHKKIIHASCNGQGQCGQCLIQVINRELKPNVYDKQLLSQDKLSQGYRLACQHQFHQDDKIVYESLDGFVLSDLSAVKQTVKRSGKGIIVDIGTTTIVVKKIDLSQGQILDTKVSYNVQGSFGSDVIRRIEYDYHHPHHLHQLIIHQLTDMIKDLASDIDQMLICGNTTMIHLFNDMDVSSLGQYPFQVPHQGIKRYSSKQLFNHYSYEVITLPHISAYVGSDIVMGAYALDMDLSLDNQVLLDLGTNGEIIAGNQDLLLSTSTAAGPAFEGQGMKCGGASIAGAISQVKLNGEQVTYKTIYNQKPTCICGSGLISCIAELKRHALINEIGRFKDGRNEFYLTDEIYVTTEDIQNFLLAKSAIQTGLKIILDQISQVKQIYISGGFGHHLEINDLIELKIIEKKYQSCLKICSNTALQGTYQLLLSQDFQRVETICQISKNINLSSHEDFEDLLIEGLFI